MVALVSEESFETATPPVFSSSELSELLSESESELLELEASDEEVVADFFSSFAPDFWVTFSSSESDESEDSELELESLDSESDDDSELLLEDDSAFETLTFFVFGGSLSDSESELESEEELLDSALRFSPFDALAAGAGDAETAFVWLSLSSSASLSELEDEDEEEEEAEEEEDEEEDDDVLASLSLSLSLLSLSELLSEPLEVFPQAWKTSIKDGAAFFSTFEHPFFFNSSVKVALVDENPF